MSSNQNEAMDVEPIDQSSDLQPEMESSDEEEDLAEFRRELQREHERRLQQGRKMVDAFVNNLLYETMCRAGIAIPRDELRQGFAEFCQRNIEELRVPEHLREWWNMDQGHRSDKPSEE